MTRLDWIEVVAIKLREEAVASGAEPRTVAHLLPMLLDEIDRLVALARAWERHRATAVYLDGFAPEDRAGHRYGDVSNALALFLTARPGVA